MCMLSLKANSHNKKSLQWPEGLWIMYSRKSELPGPDLDQYIAMCREETSVFSHMLFFLT